MNKKNIIIKTFLAGLVTYLLFFLPIPYYIERPGSAIEIGSMVEVDGETDQSDSDYMITTVEILRATPALSMMQFLPYHSGVSEGNLLGEFEDYDAYRRLQRYYMEYSIDSAKSAAFDAADLPYTIEYQGVYVMSVSPESNFQDDLLVGDSIIEINDNAFDNTDQFIDYVSELSVGETVTLLVEREGELFDVSGELILIEETGNPGIGISLVTNSDVETEPEVEIDSGNVGGPSAGLMFALQIYKVVTDEFDTDLPIAGTGTISADGAVGRIGGIDKKIVAADEEGAAVFFAPDDEIDEEFAELNPGIQTNYELAVETAEDIGTDMEIVPVTHISDAINYLNTLTENE